MALEASFDSPDGDLMAVNIPVAKVAAAEDCAQSDAPEKTSQVAGTSAGTGASAAASAANDN